MGERIAARVFGEVADVYDRVRLPFPGGLFDDVLDYSGFLPGGRRALEVGAGTGRATVAFAARGVPVVALEPDPAMAGVLRGRATRFPGVEVVGRSFEEFRPAERFGLLFSAEAWHWTAPESRWSLARRALDEGAAFAVFWHTERVGEPALRESMLDTLRRHDPSMVVHDEPLTARQVWTHWPGDELSGQPGFGSLTSRHYRSLRAVPKADFLDLTRTRSQFRMLPPPARRALLADLSTVLGDEVPLVVDTTLLLARRVTASAHDTAAAAP